MRNKGNIYAFVRIYVKTIIEIYEEYFENLVKQWQPFHL